MSATESKLLVALLVGAVIAIPAAHARITRVEIERVESPAFGGASFGHIGQYEKLVGRAYGELDPRDKLNSGIVYIDKAPLNAAGRVEYSVDLYILKPMDMARGNRTLFYDVVNRGNKRAFAVFHIGASTRNDPKSAKDAGDGFLLKEGYTIVASGWQGDLPSGNNRLIGHFPVATAPGNTYPGVGARDRPLDAVLDAHGSNQEEPDLADADALECDRATRAPYGQGARRGARPHGGEGDGPPALRVRIGHVALACEAYGHAFPGIRSAPDRSGQIPLEDHVRPEDGGELHVGPDAGPGG